MTLDGPLVFVTVGTDHHPFDRALQWVASWPGRSAARVVVQSGSSTPIESLDCRPGLPAAELQQLLRDAAVVVCHGGPATILEARHAGKLPIVVPRVSGLGEHVDDHQVRFTKWMADHGRVVLATTETGLHAALDRAIADPAAFTVDEDASRRAEVAALFGDLVDALVSDRGRGRPTA